MQNLLGLCDKSSTRKCSLLGWAVVEHFLGPPRLFFKMLTSKQTESLNPGRARVCTNTCSCWLWRRFRTVSLLVSFIIKPDAGNLSLSKKGFTYRRDGRVSDLIKKAYFHGRSNVCIVKTSFRKTNHSGAHKPMKLKGRTFPARTATEFN